VRELDVVIREVDLVMARFLRSRQELTDLMRAGSGLGLEDDLQDDLRQDMARNRQRLAELLQQTVDFPPRHRRHFDVLKDFWAEGSYEKSVFIMSKFPDDVRAPRDIELERVLQATSNAVSAAGFEPRIAQDPKRYHGALWDNVELYLLGCRQGVAIVEDRHTQELNPNVAMEWGWMRGMGKPVLFLVEERFARTRADWHGLIEDTFRWEAPEDSIRPVIHSWLSTIVE
jgi:hypothetical protein